jgi:hypothetical protein
LRIENEYNNYIEHGGTGGTDGTGGGNPLFSAAATPIPGRVESFIIRDGIRLFLSAVEYY